MGTNKPEISRMGAKNKKFIPSQITNLKRTPLAKPIAIVFIKYIGNVNLPSIFQKLGFEKNLNLMIEKMAGIEQHPIINFEISSWIGKKAKANDTTKQIIKNNLYFSTKSKAALTFREHNIPNEKTNKYSLVKSIAK